MVTVTPRKISRLYELDAFCDGTYIFLVANAIFIAFQTMNVQGDRCRGEKTSFGWLSTRPIRCPEPKSHDTL